MTQAQNDPQTQQTTVDLLTQPIITDSPVLFLEAIDQNQPATHSEQIEHNTVSPKKCTPPERTNNLSRETTLLPKKIYKINTDPAFFLYIYTHLFYLQNNRDV